MQYSNQYGVSGHQQSGPPPNAQWLREPGWTTPKGSTPGPMQGPMVGRQNGAFMLAQPNYSTVQVQQQQMVPTQQIAVAPQILQNVQAQYVQQQPQQQYRISEIPQQQFIMQDIHVQEVSQVPVIVQEVQMMQEVQQPMYYQQPVHIQEIQEIVYVPEPAARRAPTPQRAPAPQLRERFPPPPPPELYRERGPPPQEQYRERGGRERSSPPPAPPPEPEIKYVDRFVEVPVDRVICKEVPVEIEKIIVKEVPVTVEKVVYQDVPVEKKVLQDVPIEKVVFKEIPVEVEKIVTKEVPVAVEKVVVKEVQIPVEKIVERLIEKIIEKPVEKVVYQDREKIVYQDRIVYQDKMVYQDRIVEVPVERTVQYENPREGGYQITSGKYHMADQRSVQAAPIRESLGPAKFQTGVMGGREMVAFQPVEHSIAPMREQSIGHYREQTLANVSTLGSTNHVRDERERSTYQRDRMSAPFQSPPKGSAKKIGLGLKLKRNAAGYTYVQEIITGFAAHKQGQVHVDDIVIAVDHEPVEGWDLDAIKQLTMGDENTFCTLLIKRDTQYLQITLQRCFPDVVDELNMAAYSSIRSIS